MLGGGALETVDSKCASTSVFFLRPLVPSPCRRGFTFSPLRSLYLFLGETLSGQQKDVGTTFCHSLGTSWEGTVARFRNKLSSQEREKAVARFRDKLLLQSWDKLAEINASKEKNRNAVCRCRASGTLWRSSGRGSVGDSVPSTRVTQ